MNHHSMNLEQMRQPEITYIESIYEDPDALYTSTINLDNSCNPLIRFIKILCYITLSLFVLVSIFYLIIYYTIYENDLTFNLCIYLIVLYVFTIPVVIVLYEKYMSVCSRLFLVVLLCGLNGFLIYTVVVDICNKLSFDVVRKMYFSFVK